MYFATPERFMQCTPMRSLPRSPGGCMITATRTTIFSRFVRAKRFLRCTMHLHKPHASVPLEIYYPHIPRRGSSSAPKLCLFHHLRSKSVYTVETSTTSPLANGYCPSCPRNSETCASSAQKPPCSKRCLACNPAQSRVS